jgi:hypothetical protein
LNHQEKSHGGTTTLADKIPRISIIDYYILNQPNEADLSTADTVPAMYLPNACAMPSPSINTFSPCTLEFRNHYIY